jgi:hypothetical protein
MELQNLPRDQRFKGWHVRLAAYETAHKKIYDWGQGIATLGLGGLLGTAFLAARRNFPRMRGKLPLTVIWLLAWATQIPCLCWYYMVRQERFDYPVWGDSVGIPIFTGMIATIGGMLITTLLLLALMAGRSDTGHWSDKKPVIISAWGRLVFLLLWMALLTALVVGNVSDGNVIFIVPCILAMPVLAVTAFGMEPAEPRNPPTVNAGWFKFTLFHPALTVTALLLGRILPENGYWGICQLFFKISAFMLNLPGVFLLRLFNANSDLHLLSTSAFKLMPAMLITWGLIVPATWMVFRWKKHRH